MLIVLGFIFEIKRTWFYLFEKVNSYFENTE